MISSRRTSPREQRHHHRRLDHGACSTSQPEKPSGNRKAISCSAELRPCVGDHQDLSVAARRLFQGQVGTLEQEGRALHVPVDDDDAPEAMAQELGDYVAGHVDERLASQRRGADEALPAAAERTSLVAVVQRRRDDADRRARRRAGRARGQERVGAHGQMRPCCSIAPAGSTSAASRVTAACTSGQVISCSSTPCVTLPIRLALAPPAA